MEYNQSNALDAAVWMQSPGSLHHYRDQAINHLYLLASRSDEAEAFIHPAILAIVQYDQDNNPKYLEPLKVYFESSYNQVLPAGQLHIYRKSLQYRLMISLRFR